MIYLMEFILINWRNIRMSFWKAWNNYFFGALFKVLILNLAIVIMLFIIFSFMQWI